MTEPHCGISRDICTEPAHVTYSDRRNARGCETYCATIASTRCPLNSDVGSFSTLIIPAQGELPLSRHDQHANSSVDLPPASTRPLRRPGGEGLSPPLGYLAPRGARSSRGTRASPDRRDGPASVSPEICSGGKSSRNFSATASCNRSLSFSFRLFGRDFSVSYRCCAACTR